MFHFFGRGNEKQAHLAAVKERFPLAIVAADDDSLLDVSFGAGSRMRVFLPPRFPADKPVVQLMQKTEHPLVDRYNHVAGLPYLQKWTSKSSLVHLVELVVEMLAAPDAPQEAHPGDAAARDELRRPDSFRTELPAVPSHFTEVDGLSETDLEALLQDEDSMAALFESLGPVRGVADVRRDLAESNAKVAQHVVETAEKIDRAHAEALAMQLQLRDAVDLHAARLAAAAAYETAGGGALEATRASALRADATAEAELAAILAGEKTFAAYGHEYFNARVRFHEHTILAQQLAACPNGC
ncbi:hypothetical protein M885DRAFT_508382 [Pelagophyceae sp. CCMP2097]|nr:hypothetical protein M885DRAFT_508382 [Pelagophyceae sp. CCMP2097]